MAKNNKHWKNMMANEADRAASDEGIDPLEQGLEGISWFENQKRLVKKSWSATRETFGEEVGNSISSGVLAVFLLCLIPYASVRSYINGPVYAGEVSVYWGKITDAFSVSFFLITAFLASLFTTIYHCTKSGTPQKRIFHKLDHIMSYFAIIGVYAPICLSLVNSVMGIIVFFAEFALALFGMFFMVFGFPQNKIMTKIAVATYIVMGLLGVILLGHIYSAATLPSFWLIISGTILYGIGLFFYSGKKFKFAHMVWHLIVLCATVCHVLAFVFFFR